MIIVLSNGPAIADSWSPLEHAIFFGFILIAFFWAWCVFWANIRRTTVAPSVTTKQADRVIRDLERRAYTGKTIRLEELEEVSP